MNKLKFFSIKEEESEDEIGSFEFFKNIDMSNIKRIYFNTHYKNNIVRALQGIKLKILVYNVLSIVSLKN